jgi:NAD+ kinase
MRVLIVFNDRSWKAISAVDTLRSWLDEHGFDYVYVSDSNVEPSDTADETGEGAHGYDLAIAVGGDGTILRAARLVGFSSTPILGFDYGTLGFLAGADGSDLIGTLEATLDHKLSVQHRTSLLVTVDYDDGSTRQLFGLNEVAVTHGGSGRIVDFDMAIDGVHVAHLRGDGMIVSTATGSTAYALSAGGPLVAPGHKGLVVVPLAPHTLSARAIVTGPSDVVVLEPSMVSGESTSVYVDGYTIEGNGIPVKITVKRGPGDVILVGKDGERFYADIANTFFGGSGRAATLGYGAGQDEAGAK